MEWCDVEVNNGSTIHFVEKLPANLSPADTSKLECNLSTRARGTVGSSAVSGGIIRNGKWAWLAANNTLHIISLADGYTVSKYIFNKKGYSRDSYHVNRIRCVEEIFPDSLECILLAVCLESDSNADTDIALYSVHQSYVLRYIRFTLSVTCLTYMDSKLFRDSLLRNYDGCLAVGSEEGVIVILDLNIKHLLSEHQLKKRQKTADNHKLAHIVNYVEMMTETIVTFRKCQSEGQNFGLQIEVVNAPRAVCSMLSIDFVTGLAAGYEDGRIVLYDLSTFNIMGILESQRAEQEAPVQRMIYLVPPDDPRPCFYIFSLHAGNHGEPGLTAFLHMLLFEKRVIDVNNVGLQYFENLKKCVSRVHMTLESNETIINGCQSISVNYGDDAAANSLCVISWHSVADQKNNIIFFDLDQWYKEQMPGIAQLSDNPSYLSGYTLNSRCAGLLIWINPDRLAPFNPMHRFDENFYPNSLSFECIHMLTDSCHWYNWAGAQNRFLHMLRCRNASIFLEPEPFRLEILRLHLLPQFCELKPDAAWSKQAMYGLILSVCLEHQCYNLLHDCAKNWVDGSFLRNFAVPTDLSLSTLTNWIFRTANQIKTRCNDICKAIFKYGSNTIEQRVRKELDCITRQMRALANLQAEVVNHGSAHASNNIFEQLSEQESAIRLAADYQEVINWLLNIGLLPETSAQHSSFDIGEWSLCIRYPFTQLHEFYASRRKFFASISKQNTTPATGACRLLFIDALVTLYNNDEHNNKLSEFWADTNSLYPPSSIEALLRIMLVPKLSFEQKCGVVFYFLLDLNTFLDESRYKHVIQNFIKFQNVFHLSPTLVKTMETFWSLDHNKFDMAVEKFLSPMNNTHSYPSWQLELLIEALLIQGAEKLALRVMENHPSGVSPLLSLKTLLANEMLVKAFYLARSLDHGTKQTLLAFVFTSCLQGYKFNFLRELKLSPREDRLLQRILRESKLHGAETLHFAYLLQRSKYLEAVSYMDEKTRAGASGGAGASDWSMCNNYPNLMLKAYNTTMVPFTQHLTDAYLRIRSKMRLKEINNESPEPFSCQLVKQNANTLLGGIYHSSALSAHFATHYWGEPVGQSPSGDANDLDDDPMLSTTNVPFLRLPQSETNILDLDADFPISTPVPYVPVEKRLREMEPVANKTMDLGVVQCNETPRKRRRILGEEIANDLAAHFQKTKFTVTPYAEASISADMSRLRQPLSGLESPQKRPLDGAASLPPPSILKASMSSQHEKSLSFYLPSVSTRFVSPTEVESMECDDDHDEIIVELQEQARTSAVIVHKDVAQTVSANSSPRSSISSEPGFHTPVEESDALLAEEDTTVSQHSSVAVPSPSQAQLGGPTPRPSLKSMCVVPTDISEQAQQLAVSGGFGSAIDNRVATTTAIDNFASVMPLNSMQSKEFAPSVCSSKVCETQSKFAHTEQCTSMASQAASFSEVRYTECTTVVGSLNSDMSMSLQRDGTSELQPSVRTQQQQAQAYRHLDTTLGMSTYDLTTTLNTSDSLRQSTVVLQSDLEDNVTDMVSESWVPGERDDDKDALDETVEYEHIESSSSPDNGEESLQNNTSDLAEGEEEASIAPSIEFSGEESASTGNELDYDSDIFMHIQGRSLAIIPPVIEYAGNPDDETTGSSASLDFGAQQLVQLLNEDRERSALYRVNSVETLTELDTTKESNDGNEMGANDDDDDDCVVALDGTRVREFIPRAVQQPVLENETVASSSEQPEASVPAEASFNLLQHIVSGSSLDSVKIASNVPTEGDLFSPPETSATFLPSSTTSASLAAIEDSTSSMEEELKPLQLHYSASSPVYLGSSEDGSSSDNSSLVVVATQSGRHVDGDSDSDVIFIEDTQDEATLQRQHSVDHTAAAVIAVAAAATETITSEIKQPIPSQPISINEDALQDQERSVPMDTGGTPMMLCTYGTQNTISGSPKMDDPGARVIHVPVTLPEEQEEEEEAEKEREEMREDKHFERLHAVGEQANVTLRRAEPIFQTGTDVLSSNIHITHKLSMVPEEEEEGDEMEVEIEGEMKPMTPVQHLPHAAMSGDISDRSGMPEVHIGSRRSLRSTSVPPLMGSVHMQSKTASKEAITGQSVLQASKSQQSLNEPRVDTPTLGTTAIRRSQRIALSATSSPATTPVNTPKHSQQQKTTPTNEMLGFKSKIDDALLRGGATLSTPRRRLRQRLGSADAEEHVAAKKFPRLNTRHASTTDTTDPELMQGRNLRSRSVDIAGAESEVDVSTPKRIAQYSRRRTRSTRNSESEPSDTEEHSAVLADSQPVRRRTRRTSQLSVMSGDEKPTTSRATTPTTEYETARRLTRGQLASIEKSGNLSKTKLTSIEANVVHTTKVGKGSIGVDDDKASESSSSHISSSSSRRLGKRRSTRSATATTTKAATDTDDESEN